MGGEEGVRILETGRNLDAVRGGWKSWANECDCKEEEEEEEGMEKAWLDLMHVRATGAAERGQEVAESGLS